MSDFKVCGFNKNTKIETFREQKLFFLGIKKIVLSKLSAIRKLFFSILDRDVFRTQSNIYNGSFSEKL